MPPRPQALIHFLGGAFIGLAPHILYDSVLTDLARANYGILAPIYQTQSNHTLVAQRICHQLKSIQDRLGYPQLPTFGLGHSLGCKLHILSCIDDPHIGKQRWGNIFMAYSNSSLQSAVPWGASFQTLFDSLGSPSWLDPNLWIGEFDPSPSQLMKLLETQYSVAPHLLIKFKQDTIDDIEDLYQALHQKFRETVTLNYLMGDHGTSVGSRYPFTIGPLITPLDVLGQFIYENLNQANYQLSQTIQTWLKDQLVQAKRLS